MMMMKQYFITAVLVLLLVNPGLVSAQDSDTVSEDEIAPGIAGEMDVLLAAPELTWAQAARFILGAADLLPADLAGAAAESRAFDLARENRWLPKNAQRDDPARLDGTARLIMASFGLPGGIWYSLFHSPRYAYREMLYRGLIQGRADPAFRVSGDGLLRIIGKTLDYTGEGEIDA